MTTLVLDQGGHSSRALIFDEYGVCKHRTQHAIQFSAQASPFTQSSQDNNESAFIELEANVVLQSLQDCIASIDLINVDAVALICQRSNLLACRKQDLKPLTSIIGWQDTRHTDWLNIQLTSSILCAENYHAITGMRPNAHLGFSKIKWLLTNNDLIKQHYNNQDIVFLPMSAWLAAMLCKRSIAPAEILVDPSCAQRMGLLNIHQSVWSENLLKLFEIEAHALPKIISSTHHWGFINESLPLTLVGGDQSFLPYSVSSNDKKSQCFINIGSGAFILAQAQRAFSGQSHYLESICELPKMSSEVGSVKFLEATVNSAATCINQFYKDNQARGLADNIADAIEKVLFKESNDIPLYLNVSQGLGSPYWLPRAQSYFSYPSNESKEVSLEFRATIESVVFLLCLNLQGLEKINPEIKSYDIVLSGGLSQSYAMAQLLSDVSGKSVSINAEPEASALGALGFMNRQGAIRTKFVVLEPRSKSALAANSESSKLLQRFHFFSLMMSAYAHRD